MKCCELLMVDCDAASLARSFAGMFRDREDGEYHCQSLRLAGDDDRHLAALMTEIDRARPSIVVLCIRNIGSGTAGRLLESRERLQVGSAFTIATDEVDARQVGRLLELGIEDYFPAPFRAIDVLPRLGRLHSDLAVADPIVTKLKARLGLQKIVGEDPALMQTIRRIPAAARCDSTILIEGESGTGKEVCAQAIHHVSPRSGKPFVPLNCGAIPADLMENELFGHARGAFTDAGSAAEGLIQQCEGGTLFLDEVDCLPLNVQVKLLRFLQEHEYRPLGAARNRRANVRIVAASNQNLQRAMREGRLRLDLYYRLSVIVLSMPPLRERQGDIPALARHFLERCSVDLNSPARKLSRGALHKLQLYDWPGNVRELQNVIQNALVFSERAVIHPEDIRLPVADAVSAEDSFNALKARAVAQFERGYLLDQLRRHNGNITRAARAASKNRRAFWELMRKHHLTVPTTDAGNASASRSLDAG